MNWKTFRSSFLGGVFGLILGVLLGFIVKALIFEIWHIGLSSVIVYCSTLFCGVLSWFITYILTSKKEERRELLDMIDKKLDTKEHENYKSQHQIVHEESLKMMTSMDENLKIVLKILMTPK